MTRSLCNVTYITTNFAINFSSLANPGQELRPPPPVKMSMKDHFVIERLVIKKTQWFLLCTYTLKILEQFVLLLHEFSELLLQFFPEFFFLCKSFLHLLELNNRKITSRRSACHFITESIYECLNSVQVSVCSNNFICHQRCE